tara:strand:+ start:79 stop:555 length:477 start_codon:yes stop_codon:yes gene_type:complete
MATRKNLQINKKSSTHRETEIKNHGYIKGVTRGAIDPRPGGRERQFIKHYEEIKKKLKKGIKIDDWKVELAKKQAEEAQEKLNKKNPKLQKKRKESLKKAWEEVENTYVKKQMAKDEAEEKARQKKLAEAKKKKPAPKKKSPPKRKLSINRRKSRIKK